MIKLFWYTYFAIYLLIITIISRTKLYFLRKKSKEVADKYAYEKVRQISNHVLKVSRTHVYVKGKENIPEETCLFVSNHQAIFDIFLLLSNLERPTAFIAKKEIQKIPLIGGWLNQIHCVSIDRSNIREGMKAINEGVERLKKGLPMVIFPEGTRSLKSEMGEFKKGSMKLALKAKVPIVPVTVDGTYRILETGNKVRDNSTKIIFHKPIYIDTLNEADKKNLHEILHHIIENGLK